MPSPKSSRPVNQRIPVTVEHVIGELELDPMGDPTIIGALGVIGMYEADHATGGVYRVPNDRGGITTVEISHTTTSEDN